MPVLTEALLALLAAMLMGLAAWLRAVVADWAARRRLDCALARAAGLVLQDSAVQAAGQVAMEAALASARGYVQEAIPETLVKLGVPPARLEAMLRGEVGKLRGAKP